MKFDLKLQESYSRGELLLRTFFGWIYIVIPHMFVLYFLYIGVMVVTGIAWWVILFTGKYPKGMYEYVVKVMRWSARLSARLMNMADGYPKFGLNAEDENVTFEVQYPESLSRGSLLLRTFFGWIYVMIPHGFILYFRLLASMIIMQIAWWVVLFTGKYPKGMFDFNVGTYRWMYRVNLFTMYMTDVYPPFTGLPVDSDEATPLT